MTKQALIERLAGEELGTKERQDILGLGDAALEPLLIEILRDDLSAGGDPGAGWAPFHAAALLGGMGTVSAAGSLLVALADLAGGDLLEDDDFLAEALVRALGGMGRVAVESALALYKSTDDDGLRCNLCDVLVAAGVRDDRIYDVLVERLPREPELTAGQLGDYGDPRALSALGAAMDAYEMGQGEGARAYRTVNELAAAISALGGALTREQLEKRRAVIETQRAAAGLAPLGAPFDASDGSPHAQGDSGSCTFCHTEDDVQRPRQRTQAKLGRNEPCWCGSGAKYKKCHEGKDQGSLYL